MIEFKKGNIFEENADALVNPVNCVGVMGAGLAAQFKRDCPANFGAYAAACARGAVQPGKMFVFDLKSVIPPHFIINFPTKRRWRDKSRLSDIELGLLDLEEVVKSLRLSSIAIPPLGCGLGGLDWEDVRPRIEKLADRIPNVRVIIYEPIVKS